MRSRVLLPVLAFVAAAAPAQAAGVRLTAADRAGIDRALDVFVPAAIARRHPGRAFAVVTPRLRQGTKRGDWARGNLSVSPYPAVGTRFHGWTIDLASRNYVMIDTQLHPPRGSKLELTNWTIELRKLRGRWLVESALPTAFFPRPGSGSGNMHASNDLLPQSNLTSARHGRIGAIWFLVPAAVGLLLVGFPLALWIVSWRRNARAYKAYARRSLTGAP
jgi:hypothetical protein